ncbi:alpha/beta hydrolase [Solirubrobacter phytolaccae]|uniref:Alpha/beta hydrolase n=1 Tax=Solirubrobacter phytolaccae TaxID=1404360 RepID=A0A9X3SFN0_9ACTN|nr:alpha/beta hydrolase [Solirubrobacter phytolaccae]MDA0181682.1 alpha/beta hydrolase [Solirubrobacter phytolaccae]
MTASRAVPQPHELPEARRAPQRLELTFRVRGTDCAAWLYPGRGPGPAPCVILAHGFDGVREQALDRYAERFQREGLAAFVFDYRHFGASGGEPRQLMSNRRQVEDWRAAVAYARGLDSVDAQRIALWGTSNSGGHVLKVAAADPEIRAVVTQAPLISGPAQLRSMPIARSARLLGAGLRDQVGALLGLKPVLIKSAGRPYTRAVTTTPDALSGLDRITPLDSTWRNAVCARFALTTTFYSATRAGKRVRCPLLVCVADGDNVIPPGPALKLSERGTLRRYPSTHFALYYGRTFAAAARDQAEFLRTHLLPATLRVVGS